MQPDQTHLISAWELLILKLMQYRTMIAAPEYASTCFRMQALHSAAGGPRVPFFSMLMEIEDHSEQSTRYDDAVRVRVGALIDT